MAKAFSSYTLEDVAERLVSKNPNLVKVLEAAPAKGQYKALEAHIPSRLCAKIGKETGQFIPRNKLVWAVINRVNGTDGAELDW